jgi:hypothetical protein
MAGLAPNEIFFLLFQALTGTFAAKLEFVQRIK